jgi:hypothetical protein
VKRPSRSRDLRVIAERCRLARSGEIPRAPRKLVFLDGNRLRIP